MSQPEFPFQLPSQPEHANPLPDACDVVIIGGGVIGVMTAWFLNRKGLKVVLCEKGRIAGEQSSRNWGWVRQQGRDLHELPIMMEANRLWQQLSAECDEELGFRQTGILYLAESEKELAQFEHWHGQAVTQGLDTHLLSPAQLKAHLPSYNTHWFGGLYTPGDGRAEPWQAVPSLARAAAKAGVTIVEQCAVRTLETQAGELTAVVTEKGTVKCEQAVLAGGAWSSLFARNAGIRIPQLSVKATAGATTALPDFYDGQIGSPDFALRRRLDGGYNIAPGYDRGFYIGPDAFRNLGYYLPQLRRDFFGTKLYPAAPKHFPDSWGGTRRWSGEQPSPFERQRILNPKPNLNALQKTLRQIQQAFPGFADAQIRTAWAGMIDTMPDILPIVDRVPSCRGLVIATGMSGHGFGIGPGMGRVVADLVTEQPIGHDLSRFRFDRFSDGSKVELSPAF
ncbi:PTS sugar transporter subunit IID [Saccharospirillum sp. MSK14-1]|uniref:NAD(P)/FAD-dependent oxidoreductase n=1 Tax=Saccharospirillum sp. MSK14-1 TaxID=1897632 RepID=UPI000D3D7894|nr:FAD-binding oxidoreductase [Saccharospirillum sp. MSK14-1]PTY37533.1 PTS sugar transporter subunit IID [Saccharospirillum sp. MSK14-1]